MYIKHMLVSNNYLRKYNYILKLASDSIGGSGPASSNNIFQSLNSLRRFATTLPADPPPTIIKSYVSKSETS